MGQRNFERDEDLVDLGALDEWALSIAALNTL